MRVKKRNLYSWFFISTKEKVQHNFIKAVLIVGVGNLAKSVVFNSDSKYLLDQLERKKLL